jgi:hypothetical protein
MNFKEYTAQQKAILRVKLENSSNMSEFFDILGKEFNLKACSPSLMTKKTFAASLTSMVLPMLNPETNE